MLVLEASRVVNEVAVPPSTRVIRLKTRYPFMCMVVTVRTRMSSICDTSTTRVCASTCSPSIPRCSRIA